MAVSIVIDITQNSQNVANNTSNVTVKVNAKWTGGSFNTLEKSGSCTIDGTKYTFTSPFNTGQTTSGSCNLYTKTLNITHNSDGTKKLSVSASYTSGVSSGTVAASAEKTLTTIPRKSTLSVANGTLGTAQTLTVTRQATSFTHTITYTCGSSSGTICTKSSSTSISFTPPLSLASQNTSGTSVSIKYTITTYNGSTSLGSNSYTKTCSFPSSVKPSCTVTVSDAAGYANTYGAYIKGISKLNVSVAATLAYNSPIAAYKTIVNGSTYTAAQFTTDVLKTSGTLSINASVTDKRGRIGGTSATITVLDYTQPVIDRFVVNRCNADGMENKTGEYVQATFSATVTSLNSKNSATYVLKYKKSADANFTEIALNNYANNFSVTNGSYIFPAIGGSTYDVELYVTDNFNAAKPTKSATKAPTASVFVSFRKDHKGIAFGKVAEEDDLFDLGWNARFTKPVYGKVAGLDKLPYIPNGDDLDDYKTTGCWAIYSNSSDDQPSRADMIYCGGKLLGSDNTVPPARAGRFEVIASTGEGVRETQWSYLRQRFTPYNNSNAVWERDVTRSSDNQWRYSEWNRTTLTPAAAKNVYHEQHFLWGGDLSGGMYMTAGHTATLTEKVSEQPHGIILVFSAYESASDTNYGWQCFFVPKLLVSVSTSGHTFELSRGKHTRKGTKYLYIYDDRIVGHDDNNLTGTNNGITYANNKFVLRYVIGV